jgi:SAM-dependent methyltransferase
MSSLASRCPVCDGAAELFLTRAQVPVHQNLIMATPERARALGRGSLELCVCAACGFVFNHAFDASRLDYGEEYDNTQSCSPAFAAYMDELVAHVTGERGVRGKRIVEVGCGKGLFLHKLVGAPELGNLGFGFDPSYVGPDQALDGRLVFRRELYGPGCESLRADVVVCRHVIEHVADPLALLATVRAALSQSPAARVFFETPAVDWILRGRVIWDFFYEHCSLFTARSLATLFQRAGFRVDEVRHVFGGQYLWLEATLVAEPPPVERDAGEQVALARAFASDEARLLAGWRARLEALRVHGRVALWGAGAKGVTLANLADPDRELVDCVVDLNPHKQGHYLPGTGHPIVAPSQLEPRGVQSAVLMNPNYRQENLMLLRNAGSTVNLVD